MKDMDERRRIADELAAIGQRRRQALAAAEAELAAIVERAPAALAAGLTLKDISTLGAVSRPTLYSRTGLRSPAKGGRQAADAPHFS